MRNRVVGTSVDRVIGNAIPRHPGEAGTASPGLPERAIFACWRESRKTYVLLVDVFRLLAVAMREIFDESAYERYLARTRTARSVKSYWTFLQEREIATASKPRCC